MSKINFRKEQEMEEGCIHREEGVIGDENDVVGNDLRNWIL